MAEFVVRGARLAGCSLVLGENRRCIDDEPEYYGHDPAQLNRLKTMIGMGERFIASEGTTTAELCASASVRLLDALGLAREDIGAVISVTQTPDYLMPGNAHVLHGMLGLTQDAAALDVSMGCSGFVYGLWLASMIAASGQKHVLLAAGDTLSKKAGEHDRTTAPLFGDAGSAAIVAPASEDTSLYFVLHADGSGLTNLYIPAGGAREPSSPETARPVPLDEGGFRSADDVLMDGFGVFRFTMTEQPKLLKEVLRYSGTSVDDIEYFILHQANRYIVETITRKSGIPAAKVPPDTFSRYGNMNAASIPGVLCGALAEKLRETSVEAVLQGYGAGLSWGACQLRLENCLCLPPVIFEKPQDRA